MTLRLLPIVALGSLASLSQAANAPLGPGDIVRLTRGETLVLDGKNLAGAPKGQEFAILQLDATRKNAAVEYYKKDGTRVAPLLPMEALEPAPADGWNDLWNGVQAFREGRYAASRALITRATQDPKQKALAQAIGARLAMVPVTGANAAPALPLVRDLAAALCKNGQYSLGYAIDLGADRLAHGNLNAAASKLSAEDKKKGETVILSATLGRQAYAARKTNEAAKLIKAAIDLEPTRPDLALLQTKITKDLAEAEEKMNDADRMRQIPKGEVHALTALLMGLKLASDYPGLISLKEKMLGALEAKTSPPVTPALLSAARSNAPIAVLEEGRNLYTTRCAECHDLEVLDNRSVSGWEQKVAGMSGRAHLNGEQQSKIMQYITVAVNGAQ